MNTRKQVLVMTALLLLSLLLVGAYAAWYPYRAEDAEAHFEELSAERGAILFARNCRLCHGDVGEGGALGARLPAAPALDRGGLQGFVDISTTLAAPVSASDTSIRVNNASRIEEGGTLLIVKERMAVLGIEGTTIQVSRGEGHTAVASHASGVPVLQRDATELGLQQRLITNTITCGRVGTAMQPWAQTQGGTLSNEQIRQLMVLITQARWDLVKHHVDEEDLISARLLTPIDADTRNLRVSDIRAFTEKEAIRMGDERMRVVAKPALRPGETDFSGVIEVERGVLGTTPFEHAVDEEIYRFPETAEPAINQSACGQTARPTTPPRPAATIEPFTGQTVNVVAQNVAFDVRDIRVTTGGQVRVRLDNRDAGVQHNIAFYMSSTNLTPVAPGSVGTIFAGPGLDDTVFTIPAAGTYFFRCDVHPTTMTGNFIVQ